MTDRIQKCDIDEFCVKSLVQHHQTRSVDECAFCGALLKLYYSAMETPSSYLSGDAIISA